MHYTIHCTCSTPCIMYWLLVHSLICTNYITKPRFNCYHICYYLYYFFSRNIAFYNLSHKLWVTTSESEPAPCFEVWMGSHVTSNLCLGDSKPCQLLQTGGHTQLGFLEAWHTTSRLGWHLHEIRQEVWVRIAVIGSRLVGLEVDVVPGDAVGLVGGEWGAHGEQEPLLPGQVEAMQRPSLREVLNVRMEKRTYSWWSPTSVGGVWKVSHPWKIVSCVRLTWRGVLWPLNLARKAKSNQKEDATLSFADKSAN